MSLHCKTFAVNGNVFYFKSNDARCLHGECTLVTGKDSVTGSAIIHKCMFTHIVVLSFSIKICIGK